MKPIASDIIIIGGGLTGLTLSYFLSKKGINIIILEARARLGGRILTNHKDDRAPIEMGATWFNNSHTALNSLLTELSLEKFEQELGQEAIYEPTANSSPQLVALPENQEANYRIKDGTTRLINTLNRFIHKDHIYLNHQVNSIQDDEGQLIVKTHQNTFKAPLVISTLPPCLLNASVKITPKLPESVVKILEHTHTWMSESIKVGLCYSTPFWRVKNSSGTIFSTVGPITEFYDHSNFEDSNYALKGFIHGSYSSLQKEERLAMILAQLKKYYGKAAGNYTAYEEMIWSNEPFTHKAYNTFQFPHQHNGHSIYRQPYLQGKFFIAGSETAANYPGYMEGAIQSAKSIYEQIATNIEHISAD